MRYPKLIYCYELNWLVNNENYRYYCVAQLTSLVGAQ